MRRIVDAAADPCIVPVVVSPAPSGSTSAATRRSHGNAPSAICAARLRPSTLRRDVDDEQGCASDRQRTRGAQARGAGSWGPSAVCRSWARRCTWTLLVP